MLEIKENILGKYDIWLNGERIRNGIRADNISISYLQKEKIEASNDEIIEAYNKFEALILEKKDAEDKERLEKEKEKKEKLEKKEKTEKERLEKIEKEKKEKLEAEEKEKLERERLDKASDEWIILPTLELIPKNKQTELRLLVVNKSELENGKLVPTELNSGVMGYCKKDGSAIDNRVIKTFNKQPTTDAAVKAIIKELNERNAERKLNKIPEIQFVQRHVEVMMVNTLNKFNELTAKMTVISEPKEVFASDVEMAAKKIVEDGELLPYFIKTISKYHFGDKNIMKHCLTSHVSKFIKGEKLKHNAATGDSGSGKSSCMIKCWYGLPSHQRIMFGSCTEKSLFYFCRDNPKALQNKTVYIDESKPELHGALKSLTNPDGFDASHLTVDNGEAVYLNPEKPFNIWVSSVQTFTEVEMRNRFDFPDGDDDKNTKEKVDDMIVDAKAKNNLWNSEKLKNDIDYKVCRCAIQYLTETYKPNGCVIEDKDLLEEVKRFVKLLPRNDILAFMGICSDVAYLRITKRNLNTNEEIIIQKEDIEEAEDIWGTSSQKLSHTERYILELLERESESYDETNQLTGYTTHVDEYFNVLSIRDIQKFLGKFYTKNPNYKNVQRAVEKLEDRGLIVEQFVPGADKRSKYYSLPDYEPPKEVGTPNPNQNLKVYPSNTLTGSVKLPMTKEEMNKLVKEKNPYKVLDGDGVVELDEKGDVK